MLIDETKQLSEQLTGVRLDLARLETKLDAIKDLTKKVEEVDDRAKEALQSTRSAHKRLDSLKADEIKELAENQTWLWRTVMAALIAGLINLLWKGVGS
ncbi:hemolysin XhlA family protein [Paenibacillus puerhi]|uniref:hemolysin XhlA family protein n=1 Tax=Paenibacillus puerhi TaxID=2692622 RepID=UPI0013584929|nr:hemolysin XhlA family protein [Paenibacillus puerhi]